MTDLDLGIVVGHMTESVGVYTLDSRVLYVNPVTEAMFGRTLEQMRGQRMWDLFPDAVGNPFHQAFERVAATGVTETLLHYYPPFDRWFDNHMQRVGEVLIVIARDVTEDARRRRRLEALAGISAVLTSDEAGVIPVALQSLAERLMPVIDADCSLSLLSEDGDWLEVAATATREPATRAIVSAVSRWRADTGTPAEALRSRRAVLVQLPTITPEAAAGDPRLREVVETYQPSSIVVAPLLIGDTPLGVLIATRRVGDRPLQPDDRLLASEIAPSIALFIAHARRRAEAEAASRAKDQFLAMLSHELRNPLAPIKTALHLMKLRGAESTREREVIERQVVHLSRLVDDLLDVSRITRGKVDLRYERVSIAEVVAHAIEITSPLLEQRRHELEIEVPSDLAVDGDPLRLAQIVANLLSNAAKYTPNGGHVGVAAARRGDDVVLVVRDNGIGIPREMLPSVFELFVQAPQTSARPEGGLGLGLAIVRGLVELHGGRVEAHSSGAGQGTEMTVTLPAAATGMSRPARIAAPEAATRTGPARRVLVVDDNEDAAELLGDVLASRGHDVRIATDGPTALRIAGEHRPDIAVLDIGLPVMDGYELAARLRASDDTRATTLLAVTGYDLPADRERARAAGFAAHLAKPISIEALLVLIEGASE